MRRPSPAVVTIALALLLAAVFIACGTICADINAQTVKGSRASSGAPAYPAALAADNQPAKLPADIGRTYNILKQHFAAADAAAYKAMVGAILAQDSDAIAAMMMRGEVSMVPAGGCYVVLSTTKAGQPGVTYPYAVCQYSPKPGVPATDKLLVSPHNFTTEYLKPQAP